MIKIIDLFSGIGGIRIAFENQGAKSVFSSEIDESAAKVYYDNFCDFPAGDITKIIASDIPDFDVLAAGFPCQPFSIAGLRKGFEDTRGTLFFDVARILEEKKPKSFLLENVAGIISHDKGNTLKVIESILNKLGYDFMWKTMNAKDYGVPQNRNRWYCVGFRKDLKIKFNNPINEEQYKKEKFNFPIKIDLKYNLNDIIENREMKKYEISNTAKLNIKKFLNDYKQNKRYNGDNYLIANEIRASRCNFRTDGISPCLTAKMGTGGNNVPVLVDKGRKLTERECLAIMGFPKDFKLAENKMQSYKQIGNSVAIPVVELLAKEIVRLLEEV